MGNKVKEFKEHGNREMERIETAFANSHYLLSLTEEGMCWNDRRPSDPIVVEAREGAVGDWAAYHQSPYDPDPQIPTVKLPQAEAERLFPRWTERFEWRR